MILVSREEFDKEIHLDPHFMKFSIMGKMGDLWISGLLYGNPVSIRENNE